MTDNRRSHKLTWSFAPGELINRRLYNIKIKFAYFFQMFNFTSLYFKYKFNPLSVYSQNIDFHMQLYSVFLLIYTLCLPNQNSAEGYVAPAGAKVTGATIRTWLLNKFISFLAVLSWKSDKN